MLASLHIENLALIKSIDINFSEGFSALTGETGAGKSIVMDAVGMATGARVTKEIIRSGEEYALVEALFTDISAQSLEYLSSCGVLPDEDGCIFINRRFDAEGKNTVTVNGKRIPLTVLRDISSSLVNIHAQHDNAELLKSEKHVNILDTYAENTDEFAAYSDAYKTYKTLCEKIDEISVDEKEKKRRIDILKFQIAEISEAKLRPDEEEKLKTEKKKLLYSEKINKNSALCYRALYENESGNAAVDCIDRALSALKNLDGIVDGSEELYSRLEEVKGEIIDIAEIADSYAEGGVVDSTTALDRIESRLDVIKKLCSRYGADITEVLAFKEQCEKTLSETELSDEHIEKLKKDCEKAKAELENAAKILSQTRRDAAKKLASAVEEQLKYLDMNSARLSVDFCPYDNKEFTPNGNEKIEFLVRINKGEGDHSLAKTASGGELSRVMLALKTVLADKDGGADTLVFDEIDTGISGSTSRKIGLMLKKIASKKQVFCVTHSAQVSSLSDAHLKVTKQTENGRTYTRVTELCGEEKVREVARIISGMDITEASIDSARELIENTNE